ncbi:MAG TPA: hypothetical protein VGE01_11560 [Fimbriimonas sp.]
MFRGLVVLAGVATLATLAGAGPQSFARRTQAINAGVVVLDADRTSTAPSRSAAPYTFLNMNRALSAKPGGWNFRNPSAPTVPSADMQARWNIPADTKLSELNAAYWEVNVSQSSDIALSDYDVLLVAPRFRLAMSSSERAKLHKFVDKGGLLWVDLGVAGLNNNFRFDFINSLPIPFFADHLAGASPVSDFTNPLLSAPNSLTAWDLSMINRGYQGNNLGIRRVGDELSPLQPSQSPVQADFGRLQPVSLVQQGGTDYHVISSGRIGDGIMVVTARGVAAMVNGLGNDRATVRSVSTGAEGDAATRLAFNIVSLLGDFRQVGGGTRKSGGTFNDLSAPLLERFRYEGGMSPDPNLAQPALYRGMVYVTIGGRIYCLDAKPSTDLDGDGTEDDGYRDLSAGGSVDIVWMSDVIPGTVSTPSIAEVPDAPRSGFPRVQAVVTSSNGSIYIFDAEPTNPRSAQWANIGNPRTGRAVAPPMGTTTGSDPLPPTLQEGFAYIATGTSQTDGRIWVANLRNGTQVTSEGNAWYAGNGVSGGQVPGFVASPTVAYIHTADNSGGVDKVLYVPFRQNNVANTLQPGFASYWIGTKGEQPAGKPIVEGSELVVTTRAGQAPLQLPIYIPTGPDLASQGALGVRITLLRSNGAPVPVDEMKRLFAGGRPQQIEPGELRFPLNAGITQTDFNSVSGIRVDYTIDWGKASSDIDEAANQIERGRLLLPTIIATSSATAPERQILGNLAVTPRGTIFAVLADPNRRGTNGSVFAFREDAGRGSFRCVMRYDLFGSYTMNPNQGQPINYPSNFRDQDLVRNFAGPILGGDYVENMTFAGGPAIRGDKVFVAAKGSKGPFNLEVAMLLAFQAEPETPEIKVGNIGDTFSIIQQDHLRSQQAGTPEVPTILPPQSFKYDREAGVIRFENLMSVTRGPITNCISTSQPVLIRRVGQGDMFVEPEKAGGKWSPLLWYGVFHGLQARTAPTVAGNTVYFAGTSALPALMAGVPLAQIPQNMRGMCYALESDVAANDPNLIASPDRPWNRQFVQVQGSGTNIVRANEHILWPLFKGIDNPQLSETQRLELFRERIAQTLVGDSKTAYGIVAANNAAVAWGDLGFVTYGRADIVIADQGRIARIDGAGNLVWSTDSTTSAGSAGELAAGRAKPLVRPTRAYTLSGNDMLVVDSGANRVVRMSQNGLEMRAIDGFVLDPNVRPASYQPNDPLTLNTPMDAVTYAEYRQRPAAGAEVTGQQLVEYWVHTVVADTGNRRIVDIVDRYETDTQGRIGAPIQLGVLVWQSPANVSGRNFTYTSLVAVPFVDPTTGASRRVYIAGIGNATQTRAGAGLDQPVGGGTDLVPAGNNGAIVVLDPAQPNSGIVANTYAFAGPVGSALIWNEAQNNWTTSSALQSYAANGKPIGSVQSLNAIVRSPTSVHLMVAESGGVYEVEVNPANTTTSLLVGWMLPNSVYRALPAAGGTVPDAANAGNLVATYARRVSDNEVLITNGYFGPRRGVKLPNGTFAAGGDAYRGGIFQIQGAPDYTLPNFGFSRANLKFSLESLSSGRDIMLPVFADRR